jgi:hypothetical protein
MSETDSNKCIRCGRKFAENWGLQGIFSDDGPICMLCVAEVVNDYNNKVERLEKLEKRIEALEERSIPIAPGVKLPLFDDDDDECEYCLGAGWTNDAIAGVDEHTCAACNGTGEKR